MTAPYIVTLDFGSTSAKCVIFDTRGRNVAQVKRRWQFPIPNSDLADQPGFPGKEAWDLISACCREALQISQVPLDDIGCVIPTSQRHGAVILDQSGEFLFSFTNADGRNAPPWAEISQQHGAMIYRETGRWPQPVFLPAHLCWLKQDHPQIYRKIDKILGIHDWLIYMLSGSLVSERTIAGDLLLMNVRQGNWSSSVADLFDVQMSKLPPITEAGQQIGKVSAQAAKETGLLPGTPVLNGAADSQLALLGAGALEPGDAAIIFGTSVPVLYVMESPRFHPAGATWTNSHVISDQWVLESNAGDAGLFLTLFRSQLLPGLVNLDELPRGTHLPTLVELDQLASELDQKNTRLLASWGPVIFHGKDWPEVNGLIKGFNLTGNRAPGWADLYLSLVENSALAILGNTVQLVDTAGAELRRVFLGGPAMESTVWQQLLANVLANPVIVPAEKEVTPLGAAVLAASQSGIHPDLESATKAMVRQTTVAPREDLVKYYRERYLKWLEVYKFSLQQDF